MSKIRSGRLSERSFAENFWKLIQDHGRGTLTHARKESYGSVLVALSGGADSVALLQLMSEIRKETGCSVFAGHVNYGLRGAESEADEAFCTSLCRRLRIKLFKKRVSLKKRGPGNLQNKAREIRYEFFHEICAKRNIGLIATGHTKTDSVETLLLHLFRGAGTFGLSGIKAASGIVIRPLLCFTREEVLQYLSARDIPYRLDRSNLETDYQRNRLRLKLLPKMETLLGTSIQENIARSGAILAEQEQYLIKEAQRLFDRSSSVTAFGKIVLDLNRIARYDRFLQRLLLAICYRSLTGSLADFELAATERVLSLLQKDSGVTDFQAGVLAEKSGKKLYLFRRTRPPQESDLGVPGEADLVSFKLRLRAELLSAQNHDQRTIKMKPHESVYLDAKNVGRRLRIRSLRAGDRFRPLGMRESKKLSDFFIDRKLPRPIREEVPLVFSGEEIIWVVGYEIADRVKLTESTRRILKLEVKSLQND